MAATSPPAPGRDLLARLPRHASPSPPAPSAIPAANGNSKVPNIDRSIDDPIPEHLLHGGVRRVANSRSEGSEMQQSEGLGDGQDFDGDDLVNAGRKRKQCKNLPPEPKRHKNTITKLIPNQRKKPNESPLAPTIIKGASPGLRSPMQVTSSPGVNYLVKSAAVKRANMAGSPKTPQPPRCSQLGSPSLENLSPHKIARDVLAIPVSTVPSESAFSTGGCVISDYRSSLTPTTVEALICLQDWFKAADDRKNEKHDAPMSQE